MAVYLLHFDTAISNHARHYIGYAIDVEKRLEAHKSGTGSRLCQVANERHISYQVVRVWLDGDRAFERQLKRQKNARRYCPICKAEH